MKILLIALTLLTSQVSFASECILQQAIRNFNVIDSYTVEIDAGTKDYVVHVNYCNELEWSHKIGFDTFGSSRVCRGDRLLVLDTFSNQVKQSCLINSIERVK
ncbi:MAG: DUF6491 family protein [Bdellovibrionota bacterium]